MRVLVDQNPLRIPDLKPTICLLPETDRDQFLLRRMVELYEVGFGRQGDEVYHVEIVLQPKD